MEKSKTFVIVNTHFIGDTILTNSLVQNIKRLYENSRVVMVVQPYLEEITKHLKGVDEVYIWDRFNKDHSFLHTLNFVLKFPFKNPYAAFPIYGMDRPVILSRLMGAKYVLCPKQKFFSHFRNSKYPIEYSAPTTQEQLLGLLKGITKEELINVPDRIELPDIKPEIIKDLKDYIVIIPTSTRISKEFPIEITKNIISNLKNKKILFIGSGNFAREYSSKLAEYNFNNLINLTDKTTIMEAAAIIKYAKAVISADTGLMHMSCALNTPTVTLFFEKDTKAFIPDKKLYNCAALTEDYSIENILKNLEEVINNKGVY